MTGLMPLAKEAEMETVYTGKTKDVLKDETGATYLFFKDDMTGKDGIFDPGENQVGLTVEGSGRSGLAVSRFFFENLNKERIPTHYVDSHLDTKLMQVKPVNALGKGLEVICRYKAVGSFLKRYGDYIEEGQDLDGYVEITLKDDERQDPFINQDALELLGILTSKEYETMKRLTKQISDSVKEELDKKDLELYDIKLEFGKDIHTGEILLIDEISGGNMRVYKNGEIISPLELEDYLLS